MFVELSEGNTGAHHTRGTRIDSDTIRKKYLILYMMHLRITSKNSFTMRRCMFIYIYIQVNVFELKIDI